MQADGYKTRVRSPMILAYHEPLSNFASNFSLRRCSSVRECWDPSSVHQSRRLAGVVKVGTHV